MMNAADYKAFVQSVYDGRTLVGIDRVFARKLYTNRATSEIKKATGEAPHFAKLVVWFAFLGGPLAMLSSAVVAVLAFEWWALLITPAAFVLWFLNQSMSSRGDASIRTHSLLLVTAVGVHLAGRLLSPGVSSFLALFALALWCSRLLYCASTFFLRAFVMRNHQALEAFAEGISIREAG